MPVVERLEAWCGEDVLDVTGQKTGRLEEVYYDNSTGEAVLISIKQGMLGRQVTLVPAAEAVVSRAYVRVPYSAEQIDHAKSGRVDDELSIEQIAAVGALFSVALPTGGPLHGASLIERRRAEAEEANRRAQHLELEAQQRAQELDDARRRASAASDHAKAAEDERERAEAAVLEPRQPPIPQ